MNLSRERRHVHLDPQALFGPGYRVVKECTFAKRYVGLGPARQRRGGVARRMRNLVDDREDAGK